LAERLEVSVEERALRQFVSILATQAEIIGVDLQGADGAMNDTVDKAADGQQEKVR
jgi:hypothetical protein